MDSSSRQCSAETHSERFPRASACCLAIRWVGFGSWAFALAGLSFTAWLGPASSFELREALALAEQVPMRHGMHR